MGNKVAVIWSSPNDDALVNHYGSVGEYLFEELGVGDPELLLLRRKFLK